MPTGITVGRAEFGQVFRITSVCVVDPKWFPKRRSGLPSFRFASNRFLLYGKRSRVSRARRISRHLVPPISLARPGPPRELGPAPFRPVRWISHVHNARLSLTSTILDLAQEGIAGLRSGFRWSYSMAQVLGLVSYSLRRLSEFVAAFTGLAGCL